MPSRADKNAQKQRARRRQRISEISDKTIIEGTINNKESSDKKIIEGTCHKWIDLVTKAKLQKCIEEKMPAPVRINEMLAFQEARSMLAYEDEEKSEVRSSSDEPPPSHLVLGRGRKVRLVK